jgi:hypothetical protein
MYRAIVAALVVVFALSTAAHAEESSADCEIFIATLTAALDNHDIGRAAALFADDARVMAPAPISGRDAIVQWLFVQYGGQDSTVEVSRFASSGQRVTWMSRVTRGARVHLTWDEAVVADGRITLWSSRGLGETMTVMPQFQRARSLAPAGILVGEGNVQELIGPGMTRWLLVVGAVAGLVAGALFGVWRQSYHLRSERQSRQGGRMLLTLRERLRA